jgi:mRNA-degrading endonuclease toxin of MazEF toxin-antitoxin module
MMRGEVWIAEIGRKKRPVVVLTRSEVLDFRDLVTVAEVTSKARGLSVEVEIDHAAVGLDQPSVINCDGIHTVRQNSLSGPVGNVDDTTMHRVCTAASYALGC